MALHFRALRIVYRDNMSSFEDRLIKDKSLKVHHRNIHFLAIEMYKGQARYCTFIHG